MDVLAGEPVLHLGAGGAVGARLQPPALDGDHDAHAARIDALGIADQHRPAVDTPGLDRVEPGQGAIGQAGGDDGDTHDDEEPSPSTEPGERDHGAHGDARAAAQPCTHDGRERRRQHHDVGQHER